MLIDKVSINVININKFNFDLNFDYILLVNMFFIIKTLPTNNTYIIHLLE